MRNVKTVLSKMHIIRSELMLLLGLLALACDVAVIYAVPLQVLGALGVAFLCSVIFLFRQIEMRDSLVRASETAARMGERSQANG